MNNRPYKNAASLLRQWMFDDEKRSTQWVAEQLGVSSQSVSGYRSGRDRPGLAAALILDKLTNGAVKVTEWFTSEELEKLRAASSKEDDEPETVCSLVVPEHLVVRKG